MKYTGHVAIGQYEFIEVEGESLEEVSEACRAIKREWGGADGLPDKEFNAFLDRQLTGEDNHIEEYEKCSDMQKVIIQAIKRALKRIEAKQNKV